MGVSEKSHCSSVGKFIRMNMGYFVLKYAISGRLSNIVNGSAVYAQPTFAVRVRRDKIKLRSLDRA